MNVNVLMLLYKYTHIHLSIYENIWLESAYLYAYELSGIGMLGERHTFYVLR